MVWLTSLGADCCEGCVEPCSIFLFYSRKMGVGAHKMSISCTNMSSKCIK
jgi:hypothetical protein